MSVISGKREELTVSKRNMPLIQNHHLLGLGIIKIYFWSFLVERKREGCCATLIELLDSNHICPEMHI
jgi:hypothetical protein